MAKKSKPKRNPHCPVLGCRTQRPHSESEIVQGLLRAFSHPADLLAWVKGSIAELRDSVRDDVNNGRLFAYLTRWRQPEELYFRALYVLFIADEHVLSGELPNSFTAIWRKVNEHVLEGRGTLDKMQPGLTSGQFTPMETINSNAHASFASMVTCIGLARNIEYQKQIPRHLEHWTRLCNYLNYMEGMFKAGKAKAHVLAGIRNLHKPLSVWQAKPSGQ
jgi:hypothetical protein